MNPDAAIRRRVVVRGHVQGVAFRYFTQRKALEVGVAGWVRNLGDGSVEASFEGAPERVAELVEFCRHGPPSAQVTSLESFDEAPEAVQDFQIRG